MKKMNKKSIAALTVLALTSLFSLTQVTSVSANQGTLEVHSIKDTDTLRKEIKDAKERLNQRFLDKSGPAVAEDRMVSVERELPFMINSLRAQPADWFMNGSFSNRNLEEVLTEVSDLQNLLSKYQWLISIQQ
ncbi:hypothetical protein [Streptococcus halichoeri]|uniref:hypothetical protein n=1 Tax=Streptococcus halichoeri TaxID=254785 RepID=UPI00135BCE42|nr:hypothetical protein [Streptococcus halichoeri]